MMKRVPAGTRRELLLAAAREIAERGYSATSFAVIAARIGLTKGAFSYHFPTKSDLARGLMEAFHDAVLFADSDARRFFPDGDLHTAVRCLMSLHIQITNNPFARAAITLLFDPEPPVAEIGEGFRAWRTILTGYLTQAQARGQVVPVMAVEQCATHLTVSLLGADFFSRRDFVSPRLDQVVTLRILLESIGGVGVESILSEALAQRVVYEWSERETQTEAILGD